MVIVQHRLVENSHPGQRGAAGSQEPWAAADENTREFNSSSDITEWPSQPVPLPDQRASIIPFGRVQVLLKAGIAIIAAAAPIMGERAHEQARGQRVRGAFQGRGSQGWQKWA